MDGSSSVDKLTKQLYGVIDYFGREFDVNYVEVIGVLEILKADLLDEMGLLARLANEERGKDVQEG